MREFPHGVAHQDANIIFGTVIDDEMGDEVKVTVIAAGFDRLDSSSSSSGGLSLGNGGGSARITELFAEPEEAEPIDDDDDDFDVPSFLK